MALEHPKSEPFPSETLIADGWVYRDLPRMPQATLDAFLTIAGKENIRFLTFARYRKDDHELVRGQILISPVGLDRLKARHKPAAAGAPL